MKTREKPKEESGASTDGPSQAPHRPWASGRVLTAEQRARKREVDRNAGRFMKKDVLNRLSIIEDRLGQLEHRVPSRPNDKQTPAAAASVNSPATARDSAASPANLDAFDVNSNNSQPPPPPPPPQQQRQSQPQPPVQLNARSTESPVSKHSSMAPDADAPEHPHQSHQLYSSFPHPANLSSSNARSSDASTIENTRTPQNLFIRLYRAVTLPDPANALFMPPMNPHGYDMTTQFNELAQLVHEMPASLTCADVSTNEDVIVRAVFEGWDNAFARRAPNVCPLWRTLRQVDFWLFRHVGVVNRLANLYAMQRMYMHVVHGQPPLAWYSPPLAQAMLAHARVIDYLPWPALREHLVLHEEAAQALNNRFWACYAHAFQVKWPWPAMDAVQLHREGLEYRYSLSDGFRAHVEDLNNCVVSDEFATKFPELFEYTRIERQHQLLFAAGSTIT